MCRFRLRQIRDNVLHVVGFLKQLCSFFIVCDKFNKFCRQSKHENKFHLTEKQHPSNPPPKKKKKKCVQLHRLIFSPAIITTIFLSVWTDVFVTVTCHAHILHDLAGVSDWLVAPASALLTSLPALLSPFHKSSVIWFIPQSQQEVTYT